MIDQGYSGMETNRRVMNNVTLLLPVPLMGLRNGVQGVWSLEGIIIQVNFHSFSSVVVLQISIKTFVLIKLQVIR